MAAPLGQARLDELVMDRYDASVFEARHAAAAAANGAAAAAAPVISSATADGSISYPSLPVRRASADRAAPSREPESPIGSGGGASLPVARVVEGGAAAAPAADGAASEADVKASGLAGAFFQTLQDAYVAAQVKGAVLKAKVLEAADNAKSSFLNNPQAIRTAKNALLVGGAVTAALSIWWAPELFATTTMITFAAKYMKVDAEAQITAKFKQIWKEDIQFESLPGGAKVFTAVGIASLGWTAITHISLSTFGAIFYGMRAGEFAMNPQGTVDSLKGFVKV